MLNYFLNEDEEMGYTTFAIWDTETEKDLDKNIVTLKEIFSFNIRAGRGLTFDTINRVDRKSTMYTRALHPKSSAIYKKILVLLFAEASK